MGKRDPRVDAYVAKSADFAQPILNHLRKIVHRGCPEVVEELKWSAPHFNYKGMFCGMAAFKRHCIFGFWKHALLATRVKGMRRRGVEAMGQFGRLASLDDLPSDAVMVALVKEAMRLNDDGIALPRRTVTPVRDRVLTIPPYFIKAVRANKKALATFETASYSFRKEYVSWVADAKADDTRSRRLETAVKWMAEGKGRNWRYER